MYLKIKILLVNPKNHHYIQSNINNQKKIFFNFIKYILLNFTKILIGIINLL